MNNFELDRGAVDLLRNEKEDNMKKCRSTCIVVRYFRSDEVEPANSWINQDESGNYPHAPEPKDGNSLGGFRG